MTDTGRLTDSKKAAVLKSNYEGLQAAGIKPSIMDIEYVRLSELEEIACELRPVLRRAFFANFEDAKKADALYDRIVKLVGKE